MSATSYSSHNNAWASTSRTAVPVPRSTSVEYEAAAPQATNRRLPAPPDKFNRPPTTRKPLSKTSSLRHVPDSEGEEDHSAVSNNNIRGKSPFEQGLSFAKTALSNAAYYVRQRSREPEDLVGHHRPSVNGSANGNESSYDYTAEEQAFQAQKRTAAALKRNRMSVDNKAYKPSQDSEDDESEWSDDGKTKRRRRRFKKGPVGGPLSTLPVVTADKRRRRKSLGKGNLIDPDDDDSESDGDTQADAVCPSLCRLIPTYTSRSQHHLIFFLLHCKIHMRHLHEPFKISHKTTLMTPCSLPNKASNRYQRSKRNSSQMIYLLLKNNSPPNHPNDEQAQPGHVRVLVLEHLDLIQLSRDFR